VTAPAWASCVAPDKQLPVQVISDFIADPAALLARSENARGGTTLISTVRNIVASDPTTLQLFIGLLKNANSEQQLAIGTGLGQVANLCNAPDPTFATNIGVQLATSSSTRAQTNFALATGQPIGSVVGGQSIGSVAGGGFSVGGVGGSTGRTGSTLGGTPSFQPFSSVGVQTKGTNYFTSSVAGASAAFSASNSVGK
jgi:hypothetical protein